MKFRVTLFVLFIILTLTLAQYGLAAEPVKQATPSPAAGGGTSETEHEHATGHASAGVERGQVFQVTIATYLLDTAGFHVLDERLNQEEEIDPGDAGAVNRVNQVLAATEWPGVLQGQVDQLQITLATFAEALSNDDLEAAKPLATQVHEQQHDLSHAIEAWLAEVAGTVSTISPQEQMFQVTIATYLMDTAGFHAMDEQLNHEELIDPGDAGAVNRVNRLLTATAWPADLQAQVNTLADTLSQFAEALSNDDLEAAKPLATQAHEQQHDLSHAIEAWLGGMTGGAEHGTEEHGQEHESEAGGN